MALKEVKERILTVRNIRKITQARRMIASAKLHRAQYVLENAQLYKQSLEGVAGRLLNSQEDIQIPFTTKRQEGAVIVVLMGGNNGMSGAFNSNMARKIQCIPEQYPGENVTIIPVGKKIRAALEQSGVKIDENYDRLMDKISFENSKQLSERLIELFCKRKVKKIDIVYYHFKNIAIQQIKTETFLPFKGFDKIEKETSQFTDDYIFEPSEEELFQALIPMYLNAAFYAMLADNQASEFGASTMAMELATDNADKILDELQLSYNKLRQQNITSELLDIAGGSYR